jgi:hypothetical protein
MALSQLHVLFSFECDENCSINAVKGINLRGSGHVLFKSTVWHWHGGSRKNSGKPSDSILAEIPYGLFMYADDHQTARKDQKFYFKL